MDVHACPQIFQSDLIDKIRSEVTLPEFLFFREGVDEFDVFFGERVPCWEMECTACGQTFLEPKRGRAGREIDVCPQCGARVEARPWRNRAPLDGQEFSYQLFQRGEGADLWLRSWQVRRNRDGSFDTWEYARVLFRPGNAARWTRSRNWVTGETEWTRRKKIVLKRWYGAPGQTRDNYWGGVTEDEVRGTALEYCPASEVLHMMYDPVAHFDLFIRYPACEYVWKMGLGYLFREVEGRGRLQEIINLSAQTPDKLIRDMNKAERKLLQKFKPKMYAIRQYKEMRALGACRADADSMRYAIEAANSITCVTELAEKCGVPMRELRRYHERQARRMNNRLGLAIHEHRDYIDQLDRLDIEHPDYFPPDLHEAHTRLSQRERMVRRRDLNDPFRIRRHLLGWMRYRWGGMFIRPIDSPAEIVLEGEQQNNCVAGYAQRHADGRTAIFVLRQAAKQSVSWYTVEINPRTLEIIQCRGYHNRELSPAEEEAKDKFMAHWAGYLARARKERTA